MRDGADFAHQRQDEPRMAASEGRVQDVAVALAMHHGVGQRPLDASPPTRGGLGFLGPARLQHCENVRGLDRTSSIPEVAESVAIRPPNSFAGVPVFLLPQPTGFRSARTWVDATRRAVTRSKNRRKSTVFQGFRKGLRSVAERLVELRSAIARP